MTTLRLSACCFALSLALGCQNTNDKPPATALDSAAASNPRALVPWYQTCWGDFNDRKWDDFSSCYADDATSVQIGAPELRGKAAILAAAQGFLGGFPDAKGSPQIILADGRDVFSVSLMQGTQSGTFKGPMGDIPATGKTVGYLTMHHVEVNAAGKVAKETWIFDMPTFMAQLGLSQAPARTAITGNAADAPRVLVASGSTEELKNAAAVKSAYDLFSKHDPAFDDYFAEDVTESTNSEPVDTRGRVALSAHNRAFITGFPDLAIGVEQVWAAGNYTIDLAHVRGTNSGELAGVGKTGKSVDITLLELIEWRDGKVQNAWPFMNGLELGLQLGLVPRPAQAEGGAGAAAGGKSGDNARGS